MFDVWFDGVPIEPMIPIALNFLLEKFLCSERIYGSQ